MKYGPTRASSNALSGRVPLETSTAAPIMMRIWLCKDRKREGKVQYSKRRV